MHPPVIELENTEQEIGELIVDGWKVKNTCLKDLSVGRVSPPGDAATY